MESVLLSGTASKAYLLEPSIINDIIEQWSSVPVEPERLSPQEKYFCYLKGRTLFRQCPFKCDSRFYALLELHLLTFVYSLMIIDQVSTARIAEMICKGFV
jgi:hypothetical protein